MYANTVLGVKSTFSRSFLHHLWYLTNDVQQTFQCVFLCQFCICMYSMQYRVLYITFSFFCFSDYCRYFRGYTKYVYYLALMYTFVMFFFGCCCFVWFWFLGFAISLPAKVITFCNTHLSSWFYMVVSLRQSLILHILSIIVCIEHDLLYFPL